MVLVTLTSITLVPLKFVTHADSLNNEMTIRDIEVFEKEEQFNTKEELDNYRQELITQLENEKDFVEKKKIKDLIESLDVVINDYNKVYERNDTKILLPPNVDTVAVAAVIAYFKSNGYKLAAELLVHARSNKVIDSNYAPTAANTVQIRQTSVFKTLMNGSTKSGTSAFKKSNSNSDLYYAIHAFSYEFSGQGAYRTLFVTDRYDFESDKNYPTVQGVAVNAMLLAQRSGTIKPFKVKFSVTR